ncbi:unnamed protein product [Leptidea sinapis]|uniref:ABC transmembrane type-1 domain-containing protein n=1 Tax=Leptidea sinapis TaxID=189913 RepID=A0A5E4R2M9_9NEOP|nr:unnamed protein product [Leptidea sinapis]
MGSIASGSPPPDLIPQEPDVEEKEPEIIVSSWQILKLNSKEWPLLVGGGLASLTIGATMPVFAFLFSKLFGMFSWPDREAILHQSQLYAGLFACAAVISGLVTFLQAYLFGLAGAKLTDRLRIMTFANYLRQDQGWFDEASNSVGALCSRLGTMLQGVSTMVLGVGLAMFYSWKMTLVSLLSVPCVIGGICLEGWINKKTEAKERNAIENASRLATEAVLNYSKALDEAEKQASSARWIRGPIYGLCLCSPTLGYAVSVAYGGYLIAREDLKYEYVIL